MIGKHTTRQLVLAGALAMAVSACGGSSGTAAPAASSGTGASTGTASPAPASQGAGSPAAASQGSGGSVNAISALSDLNSYKIKLVIGSTGVSGGLGSMGNITMAGMVVLKPAKATDITMTIGGAAPGASADASAAAGMGIRIVEVNGKSYTDLGTGTLTENTDPSQTSMADSLSPDKLLGETSSYLKDMKATGDEQKNGIATTHYQADASVLKEAAAGLAMLGLTNASWKWDVWLAKEGGYVVSYQLVGTGSDNAQMTMSLDISDVNSPSNVVKAP